MKQHPLGKTALSISPIVFGGNVFGWTIDEKRSFELLDAFVDHGFDTIDTADVYSVWAPGNKGGESEAIIGRWLKSRPGVRDKVKIFTKGGADVGDPLRKGLSKKWITQAFDESLRRLGSEYIDVYFSHFPDDETPHEETLAVYQGLIDSGKARILGASNFSAQQLREANTAAARNGLQPYQVIQPEYNLYDRESFETELKPVCDELGLGVVTYYSLASGFLTGKYRDKESIEGTARYDDLARYMDARGRKILDALQVVAHRHDAKMAEVALAWLIAQPGISAPIASATSLSQLESFKAATEIKLSPDDLSKLADASE
ncbi:aldo/keto reductase [Pseudomonas parafulva]|uniref:aldo/keto reductase n=1 Tax=Pseudomonas parafulva TaxID=157782 RepID=UPI00054087AD|nr:aldo/keto reductase [Pseudomonas parafulva]AIZ35432.1 alcohol dehydrogenase [Pseudomonas parafulva]